MYRNFIRAVSAVAAAVFLGVLASIYNGLDARSTECVTDSECEALDYGPGYFGGIAPPAGFTFGE